MSHHRLYNYDRVGSEEGLRRDKARTRLRVILMLVAGIVIIALLVFLSVVK